VAAALFSLRPGHRKLAAETIVGLGYIVASALVLAILNSPRIAQEAHAVGDILFGNAVTVPRSQIYALAGAGAAALLSACSAATPTATPAPKPAEKPPEPRPEGTRPGASQP
jgi:ABC-type Mn2+/Zn2+ transport system permease subunit